jgi:hypothetical protein
VKAGFSCSGTPFLLRVFLKTYGKNSCPVPFSPDGGESINIVLLNRLYNKNSVKASKFAWEDCRMSRG